MRHQEKPIPQLTKTHSLVASSLTAVGASVCCIGPLLLVSLGIGGTWIGLLTKMEPFRPFFILLTLAFLGLAFHKLYRQPQPCNADTTCANPRIRKRQQLFFWITTLILLLLLASPQIITLFF